MPYDLGATVKQAEQKYNLGAGGGRVKIAEGDNRMRILSRPAELPGEYNGKPTFKWVWWVIDRKDGKVKLYFMPNTIMQKLQVLQKNPEYAFEDFPMPYDITINATGAGTIDVEYQLTAARNNTPLTAEEQAEFAKQLSIEETVARIQAEKGKAPASQTSARPDNSDISVEDIPF